MSEIIVQKDTYKILIAGDDRDDFHNLNLLGRIATGTTVENNPYNKCSGCPVYYADHNSDLKLQIWVNQPGPPSNHRGDSIVRSVALRNAQGAMILYDNTNKESLERSKICVGELQRRALPEIVIALVGYEPHTALISTDLNNTSEHSNSGSDIPNHNNAVTSNTEPDKQVIVEVVQQYATEIGALHIQVCLKTGENVKEVTNTIVSTILERNLEPLPKYIIKQGGHDKSKDTWDTIHCMIM